jgi:hypothetical protein
MKISFFNLFYQIEYTKSDYTIYDNKIKCSLANDFCDYLFASHLFDFYIQLILKIMEI